MVQFRSIFEIDFQNPKGIFKLRSILHQVYFIPIKVKKYKELLLKYKQNTFFFLLLYFIYTSDRVIMNLYLSKAAGPDCIRVVVLKNCEPELSYILAELFNKCLKESCFPDCWKVSTVVPVFKHVGERSTAKTYCPVLKL